MDIREKEWVVDPMVKCIELPEEFIKLAVIEHVRCTKSTRQKYMPWSPDEVLQVVRLYLSGLNGKDIQTHHFPKRNVSSIINKRRNLLLAFGDLNYAKKLHLHNRAMNILGEELKPYNQDT